MKYIFVTALRKGIGQGVTTCSIGTIMKACDLNVTAIKIDSEYNASLLHGREEVFVLEDGSDVHSHLGCFERFLDVTLHRDNYIKVKPIDVEDNQIYKSQYIKEVKDRIVHAATTPVTSDKSVPEVCVIELGATIWDIHFHYVLEALHQLRSKEDTCCIHVCQLQAHNFTDILLQLTNEIKIINEEMNRLVERGFKPDLVMCHSKNEIADSAKNEFSNFCNVSKEQVIWIQNFAYYEVPLTLESQNVIDILAGRLPLNIPHQGPRPLLQQWKELVDKCKKCKHQLDIALLHNNDGDVEKTYRSIITAVRDAAFSIDYKVNIKYINTALMQARVLPSEYSKTWKSCSALIVTDGFKADVQTPHPMGLEERIEAIKWARENKIPFLGIGQGMELAVIEFARNVLFDNTDINSQNWFQTIMEPQDYPCLPCYRLGSKTTRFCTQDSTTRKLYGSIDEVNERHRRERDLSPYVINNIERKGLRFVGKDVTSMRMEIMELDGHPYFVGLQFHPEYTSRLFKPAPPFLGLVLAATGKLKDFIDRKEGISDSE